MCSRVVILGAGYAGLRACLDLATLLRRPDLSCELLLVNRSGLHELVTTLHLVATEAMDPSAAALPLRECLPPNVRLVEAEVRALALQERRIDTSAGSFDFDRLVIALGSETSLPPIPGLEEHAFFLRWKIDAERLREHVRSCFQQAARTTDSLERRSLLRLVVAGGGFTGCQLAGELAHWVTDLCHRSRLPAADVQVILAEAESRLLPGGPALDSSRALRILEHKGVDVRPGTKLESVQAASVVLGDETLKCRTVVWVGGIRGPRLLGQSGLQLDDRGRCRVDSYLRPLGFSDVFAVGDCARFEIDGRSLPAAAAVAVRQGAYVAAALKADLTKGLLPGYEPLDTGLLVSLGGGDAVGDLLGVPLTGRPGGLLKEAIEGWYGLTVRGLVPTLP